MNKKEIACNDKQQNKRLNLTTSDSIYFKNSNRKVIKYYRLKIEHLGWIRKYLEGCKSVEENPKEVNYESHVEKNLIELLKNCTTGKTRIVEGRPILSTPLPLESMRNRNSIILRELLIEPGVSIKKILKYVFKEGEQNIINIDVTAKNALGILRRTCMDMHGVYRAIWEIQNNKQLLNPLEDIEGIIECERFGTVITNKAFEYIGFHRGKIASVKQKSDAGSTYKKNKEACKAHILNVLEEKQWTLYKKEEDIEKIVAYLKEEKLLKEIEEPQRTVKRYIKQLAEKHGKTIDGTALRCRKPKKGKINLKK